MNLNFLRLIAVMSFLVYAGGSTAGEWGKGITRIVIPFGLTADQLPDPQSKGAVLLVSYCSQCHNLPNTKMHSTGDWPMMFERMMDHAKLMAGSSSAVKMPADKEKQQIVSYLKKNGFKELPADSPLRGEPLLFNVIWFCSVCHAIPDPDQFPANEWGGIVDRMNSYRKMQGRDEMNNFDRKKILNFLEKKQ